MSFFPILAILLFMVAFLSTLHAPKPVAWSPRREGRCGSLLLLCLISLCRCDAGTNTDIYPPCASGWCRVNPLPEIDGLRKVRGTAAGDVWAVGDRGAILQWDGASWKPHDSGYQSWLTGVWGSRNDDVWTVGEKGTILHWDVKSAGVLGLLSSL